MSRISPQTIDEIMQTARIEEVIGDFVQLKKTGANYKGKSPFVDEKTPSFVVSPAKQIFKCFSTGKGGSAVTFLMELEQFSYPEALRWLARRYNIEIPDEKPQTAEELAIISERDSLFIVNEFAKDHFKETMLTDKEGISVGLSYFEERGFKKEIIEKFQLGYCLNSGSDFTEASKKKGYDMKYMLSLGLVKEKDGRFFDFFRGRVMFPIQSSSGRVLGFGGRTLFTDKKIAKYFNSPESPIYDKSSILYGLYFAKQAIAKYDLCYLVEGYTDVIAMHQAGVENVVSSSGTSLTDGQIKLVKRFTNNITILYDGDSAGIKASFRGIDMLLKAGMNIKVLLFPDGDDPDSYSKKVSQEEFQTFIAKNQKDFITFKTDLLQEEYGDDPIKRADLIRQTVASIALIPDNIIRTVYIKQAAQRFDITENTIVTELNTLRKKEELNATSYEQRQVSTNPNFVPDDLALVPPEFLDVPEENLGNPFAKRIERAEYELARILVRYGSNQISIQVANEKDVKESMYTTVAELICHDLALDEMTFENKLYHEIHTIIAIGISEGKVFEASHFRRMENQEIVKFMADVETERDELSPKWREKYGAMTLTEVDKIYFTADQAILRFKKERIESEIAVYRHELEANKFEDEIHQMSTIFKLKELIEIRNLCCKKLGINFAF